MINHSIIDWWIFLKSDIYLVGDIEEEIRMCEAIINEPLYLSIREYFIPSGHLSTCIAFFNYWKEIFVRYGHEVEVSSFIVTRINQLDK